MLRRLHDHPNEFIQALPGPLPRDAVMLEVQVALVDVPLELAHVCLSVAGIGAQNTPPSL